MEGRQRKGRKERKTDRSIKGRQIGKEIERRRREGRDKSLYM